MADKAEARIKGKKKRWFTIIAPAMFSRNVLGEIYLYSPEQAMGRRITANLMNLIGDIKQQNMTVQFVINNSSEGKLHTDIVGYELMPTAVKRMIRRRIAKILMSFVVKATDRKIRIKPLILTRSAANQSVLTDIRNKTEELLRAYVEKISFDNVLHDIISHKLQMTLKKELCKIFPIRTFEVRKLEIAREKMPGAVQAEMPAKKKKAAVKEEKKEGEPAEKPKEAKKKAKTKKKEAVKEEEKAAEAEEEKKE